MKKIVFIMMMMVPVCLFAHSSIKGKITQASNKQDLPGAYVKLVNTSKATLTETNGTFEFKNLDAGEYTIQISMLGYKPRLETVTVADDETKLVFFTMEESTMNLSEINITPTKEAGLNSISSVDMKLRIHNTTQDLLRLVPGLFIAQHAGGGKAEQIFLRGFDVDHGTDIAISVDGIPVNMPSHAHGQGYADLHFVIPETVDNLSYNKGPYDAKVGNLNTAGAVRFQTKNRIDRNMLKVEAGRFGLFRTVGMINLINGSDTAHMKHKAYIAGETLNSRGYFENPQDFTKLNVFGKYIGHITPNMDVVFMASTFTSKWNASGQIPNRAVESGTLGYYGSIDPSEGGNTSRTNISLSVNNVLKNNGFLKNQIYYVNNKFNLYSNFTFYKDDSLRGDEINQYEKRNMLGYNGSYSKTNSLGNVDVKSVVGWGFRGDAVWDIGLSHVTKRIPFEPVKKGHIDERNAFIYLDESFFITPKLTVNAGLRMDNFSFYYFDKLTGTGSQTIYKTMVNPKLNVYYNLTDKVQVYASTGTGFHTNDTRVTVQQPANTTIPRTVSADIGTNLKIRQKLVMNAAIWAMDLETEYVYSGDDGTISPSGKTRRYGLDLSARYQIYKKIFADADLNLARPRYLDLPDGKNFVPLAPTLTSVGGLSYLSSEGFSGSIRYRHLNSRPAIEDNSIVAVGYFIVDAVLNYSKSNYLASVSVENLFNKRWKEAQFATETKLQTEATSTNEIHFTPGTPFFIKASISYFFK
jgi:hypothetical protein